MNNATRRDRLIDTYRTAHGVKKAFAARDVAEFYRDLGADANARRWTATARTEAEKARDAT